MTYDPEKYRAKREKVLGIKKRGPGFGTLAAIVSTVIILGLGAVTVPRAVSYMVTRHLDDVIFKLESGKTWPTAVLAGVTGMDGVKTMTTDAHDTRLVVTFDRRTVNVSRITALFRQHNLNVTLLNRLNHRQHQDAMKKEAEEYETS